MIQKLKEFNSHVYLLTYSLTHFRGLLSEFLELGFQIFTSLFVVNFTLFVVLWQERLGSITCCTWVFHSFLSAWKPADVLNFDFPVRKTTASKGAFHICRFVSGLFTKIANYTSLADLLCDPYNVNHFFKTQFEFQKILWYCSYTNCQFRSVTHKHSQRASFDSWP